MTDALALAILSFPALATAVATDVSARRVPNWVPAWVATCGIAARAVSNDAPLALLAAGLTFAILYACWRRGWIGGGDVKLLAACSLLVPAAHAIELVFTVTLAGGLLATLYGAAGAALRRRPARPALPPGGILARITRIEVWRMRRSASLPYACAIAAGGVLSVLVN